MGQVSSQETSDINLDEDSIPAERNETEFMDVVDSFPQLYDDAYVRQALRRYELFWLPLAARERNWNLIAPLDVAWVWFMHMHVPKNYGKDCFNTVGGLVDHNRLMNSEQKQTHYEKTRAIWENMYPTEPFEVSLDAPAAPVDNFESKLSDDLVRAVRRLRIVHTPGAFRRSETACACSPLNVGSKKRKEPGTYHF